MLFSACGSDEFANVVPIIEVEPEHFDFGRLELTQQAALPAVLRNVGGVRGTLREVEWTDNCGGCFQLSALPEWLEGESSVDLTVRLRADQVGTVTATAALRFEELSDAIEMTMIGWVEDGRRPDIEVVPGAVDFGFAPVGQVKLSSIVVRSVGTNDLFIDHMYIEPANAPFEFSAAVPTPDAPGQLEPGDQATVGLRARLLTDASTAAASIFIETNVLEEKNVPGRPGVLEIPLTARANRAPVAVINAPSRTEPGLRVRLDGSDSTDPDGDLPLSYAWRLLSAPEGASAEMERPSAVDATFWADQVGRYEVELVVTDAVGLESPPAVWVVEALPGAAVNIELTWDHPDADLDLHLMRPDGLGLEGPPLSSFCDCLRDCHYRDCARTPNWFPASVGANPRLDQDDRGGFGPESIRLDGHGAERSIPDGRYTIGVHYYATNEELSEWPTFRTTATVRVYLYGQLAGEFRQVLGRESVNPETGEVRAEAGDLWWVADLVWPMESLEPLGDVVPGLQCGKF